MRNAPWASIADAEAEFMLSEPVGVQSKRIEALAEFQQHDPGADRLYSGANRNC